MPFRRPKRRTAVGYLWNMPSFIGVGDLAGCAAPQTRAYGKERTTMIGAIILGIIAGFVGRLIMPGRDKMGFIPTVLLGLAGAVVGWLIFTDLLGIGDKDVFDLGGLLSAIIGVVIILGVFRLIRARRHSHS